MVDSPVRPRGSGTAILPSSTGRSRIGAVAPIVTLATKANPDQDPSTITRPTEPPRPHANRAQQPNGPTPSLWNADTGQAVGATACSVQ